MILLFLLLGCGPKQHSPLFPEPLPVMVAPQLEPLPGPEVDDCPAAVALNPGEALPEAYYLDGRAQCRATVLAPSTVPELLRDGELRAYWQDRAVICHDNRERDRAYADAKYVLAQADLDYRTRGQMLLEVAVVAGVPAALIVGIILGHAAAAAGAGIPIP